MELKERSSLHRSSSPHSTVRVFVDFDGTVTRRDVGDELFRRLCSDEAFNSIIARWECKDLTGPEMYDALCSASRAMHETEFEQFLSEHEVEASFGAFVQWCESRSYPLIILSDGCDAYIEPLLRRAGLHVEYKCNTLRFENGFPRMQYPFFDPRRPMLANCKSNHIALSSRDDDIIVYVGDGRSDFEAACYADMVFACGVLETYCQEKNITFRRFGNFHDVRLVLSDMIDGFRLRHRMRARLLRRQLWLEG